MVRFTFLNSFVTLAHFIVIAVVKSFCYIEVEDLASHVTTYYFEKSASVSFKAAGIIYQSKY